MQESAAKKDTAKLQRVIIDGLEDVKAQDIAVFDTEHLSALFERVIIASGTSNRQTKALAASVRDAVREAGFVKPRVEGEDNGEWIIVDCGQCVVHVMQPAIRTYYHLEEIWGEKPVRLKLGAPKPAQPARAEAAPLTPAKKAATKKAGAKNAGAAKSGAAKSPAIKSTAAKKAAPAKSPVKAPAKKAASKTVAKPVTKTAPKSAAKKPASKTAPAKRSRA
jgi:ribosome-associated protein